MFNTIIGIISGTPLWVWILFGYLLYRGIIGLKSRILPISNLFTMPLIFLALALQNIVSRMCACFNFPMLAVFVTSLLVGMGFGWLIVHNIRLTAVDKKRHLIAMPGSAFMLLLTLFIFGIKYFFGVMKAINPALMSSLFAVTTYSAVSGAFAGLTIGRMLHYLYLYNKAPHTDL